MSTVQQVVEAYFAAWNETDPERRAALLAESCAENVTYVDPMMQADGREGILNLIVGLQGQFPKHVVKLVGDINSFQNRAKFDFQMYAPDGSPVIGGVDFVILSEDGKFENITGFYNQSA